MKKRIILIVLFLVLITSVSLVFSGCSPTIDPYEINGRWCSVNTFGDVDDNTFWLFNNKGKGTSPDSTEFTWKFDEDRERYTITFTSGLIINIEMSEDKKVIQIQNKYFTKGNITSHIPKGGIKINNTSVTSGTFTNKSVTCWFEVDLNSIGSYATINDEKMTSFSKTITADGIYELKLFASDGSQNQSYIFTIKTKNPIAIFSVEPLPFYHKLLGYLVAYYTNQDISIFWEGNGSATVNSLPYAKNTLLTDEGTYDIVLTDEAGNISNTTLVILKTSPIGYFSPSGYAGVLPKIYDTTAILPTISYKRWKFYYSAEAEAYYEDGTSVGSNNIREGTHTITLIDRAGNETIYTYTL